MRAHARNELLEKDGSSQVGANGSILRRRVQEAVAQFDHIYALLHPYRNGYLPTMKLSGKERDGARVRKHYDQPRTPYRRAEQAGVLVSAAAGVFTALLTRTGPLTLRRQIDAAIATLWTLRVKSPAALGQTA